MSTLDLSIISLVSIQSFYFSVSRSYPPSLSFSKLKVLTKTPTNRFRKKKEPTIMKTKKKKIQGRF
jgi:hypothetical protein